MCDENVAYKLFQPDVLIDIYNQLNKRQLALKQEKGGTQIGCIAQATVKDQIRRLAQNERESITVERARASSVIKEHWQEIVEGDLYGIRPQ